MNQLKVHLTHFHLLHNSILTKGDVDVSVWMLFFFVNIKETYFNRFLSFSVNHSLSSVYFFGKASIHEPHMNNRCLAYDTKQF